LQKSSKAAGRQNVNGLQTTIGLVVRNRVTIFHMPAIVAKLYVSSPYYLN